MPTPGQEIKLNPELAERLGAELCAWTQDLENEHAPLFRDYDIHRDWYEARPANRRRNTPWPGASNIVIPIIQVAVDNLAARLFFKLHTPRKTWIATSENEDWRESLVPLVNDMNWESRNTYDIRMPSVDWLHDGLNLGQAYLGLRWERRFTYRFVPGARGRRAVRRIETARGPVVDFIPPEQLLKHRDLPLQESDIVIRQSLMTWNDIAMRTYAPAGAWREEDVQACKNHAGVDGLTQTLLRGHREREGLSTSDEGDLHDVRQAWVQWSSLQLLGGAAGVDVDRKLRLGKSDPAIPVVITFHRRARKILRITGHPYYFTHWPFYEVNFRRRPGRGTAAGIAKRVEHMQRAASTMVNQAIDAVTRANSISFVTTNQDLARRRFRPDEPIYVTSLNNQAPEIMFPQVPKGVIPEASMLALVERMAERQTGVTDPTSGRETRMGGHPAPATTTLSLLQNADIQSSIALEVARKSMSQIGEDIVTLKQQFALDDQGRLERVHGAGDAAQIQQILFPADVDGFLQPVAGNLHFDIYALSETMNPDAERQKSIVVAQMTQNYFANLTRLAMLMANPQVDPFTKQIALQSMKSLTESQKRFLESSDVDDIDAYVMQIKENRANDQAELEQLLSTLQSQQGVPGQPGQAEGSPAFAGIGGIPGNGQAGPIGMAGAPGGPRL